VRDVVSDVLSRILLPPILVLEGGLNRLKVARLRRNAAIHRSSRLYPEARICNFQKNPSRIRVGRGSHVRGELLVFANGGEVVIGDNCFVGEGSRIWSGERIVIGDNVLISHNVNIVDTNAHEINHIERAAGFHKLVRGGHPKYKTNVLTAPVAIGDYAWISFNACILRGVTIGRGAIVGGGSVVSDDVPDFAVVAGNPARIIRKLDVQ